MELSIEFALTRKQVDLEHELGTAVTLTRRAASLLTQAEDLAVLQGDAALANGQMPNRVRAQGAAGQGLVAAATDTIDGDGGPEGIFRGVAEAAHPQQACCIARRSRRESRRMCVVLRDFASVVALNRVRARRRRRAEGCASWFAHARSHRV